MASPAIMPPRASPKDGVTGMYRPSPAPNCGRFAIRPLDRLHADARVDELPVFRLRCRGWAGLLLVGRSTRPRRGRVDLVVSKVWKLHGLF